MSRQLLQRLFYLKNITESHIISVTDTATKNRNKSKRQLFKLPW